MADCIFYTRGIVKLYTNIIKCMSCICHDCHQNKFYTRILQVKVNSSPSDKQLCHFQFCVPDQSRSIVAPLGANP